MRLLRRYIATEYKCSTLLINNYEISAAEDTYICTRRVLIWVDITDHFDYTLYRKTYHGERMISFAMPLRIIHFAYPLVWIYNDKCEGTCRVCVVMDENKNIYIEEYNNIPF